MEIWSPRSFSNRIFMIQSAGRRPEQLHFRSQWKFAVCETGNGLDTRVRGSDIFAFSRVFPFSALDAENEYLVQEALDRLMEGRTVLIIAHRLSTIKNANMVAVLDQGKIIECGKHKELLSKPDGLYRKLMNKQSFISA